MHQAQSRRRDARNPARLPDRAGAHALELFAHLARKPADGAIFQPLWNRDSLGSLQLLNRFLLLLEIAGELDLGFDRTRFIAHH